MRTTLNPTFRLNLLCRGLKYSSLYHLHYISPAPTMGGFAEEYKVRNFDHEPWNGKGYTAREFLSMRAVFLTLPPSSVRAIVHELTPCQRINVETFYE
jgi:hypothetical protein